MDEKQKKILVRELCARLPYGVQVRTAVKYKTLDIELLDAIMSGRATFDILPLLRPMESMTEKEQKEYAIFIASTGNDFWNCSYRICS